MFCIQNVVYRKYTITKLRREIFFILYITEKFHKAIQLSKISKAILGKQLKRKITLTTDYYFVVKHFSSYHSDLILFSNTIYNLSRL